MKLEAVAAKYARALVSLAREKGKVETIERELVKISDILKEYPQLEKILCQPAISREEKSALLHKICGELDLSDITGELFALLARKGRLRVLATISEIYKDEAFLLARRLKVEVKSAFALTHDEKDKLKKNLSRILKRDIMLKTNIDKTLLGGVKIRVGHTLYDGTIRAGLDKMRGVLA